MLVLALVPVAPAQPTSNVILRFDAGGLDLGEGVALGPDGSVAVTGTGGPSDQRDMVTALFDVSGSLLWARRLDNGPDDRGGGVAVDSAGNVYAAGTSRTAGDDLILVKYSPDGNRTWSVKMDKGTSEVARAVTLDPEGNIIVAGASVSANGVDGFVSKFSSEGTEIWAKPVNLFWLDEFFAVDSDPEGNIVAAGRVASGGAFDAIVRKFSPSGNALWTQYVKGPGNVEGRGVAFDRSGNVFLTGTTAVVFDGGSSTDVLVSKFSASGTLLWSKEFDAGGEDEGRGAASDSGGNVLVTGFSKIGNNKDPFLLKVDPKGDRIWRQTTTGVGIDGTGSIAVSDDGATVVLAGASQRTGADFDYLVIGYDQGRPSAAFQADRLRVAANQPIAFEDQSVPGPVPLISRRWDFGDGTNSTEANPAHQYPTGGKYLVRLTVRDSWGNEQTASREVSVTGASASPDTGPAPGANSTLPGATTEGGGGPNENTEKPKLNKLFPILGILAVIVALATAAHLARKRHKER